MSTRIDPARLTLLDPFKIWLQQIRSDQKSMRIIRFAVGVTLAAALAYSINWPLSFILPVLTSVILALPLPMPSLKVGLRNMMYTIKAFVLGLIFSLFFLQFPLAYVPMLALVKFHLYYYLNRGGSFWLVLMSILAILLLPILANSGDGLAIGFSLGFILSGCLTIIMVWIAHLLIPDPEFSLFSAEPAFQPGYSEPAARSALKSTVIIVPLAILFVSFDLSSFILVLIFSAIFILKPELSAGKDAGRDSLTSTVLGGLIASLFYILIVAEPEFHFYIVLLFFTTLIFAMNIFSAKPSAKYYASACTALLVLINGSMAEGANFTSLFVIRIVLIILAIYYIVAALKILDYYFPNKIRQ